MSFFIQYEQKIPVKYKTQVLVLGGGPSGMSAAISASKNNTEVMLLERYGFLGGQSTGGLVIVLCGLKDSKEQIIKGYCQDVIDYLQTFKATTYWNNYIVFEPEALKKCFDEQIKTNKIKLLLHSFVVNAIKDNNNIKYIIVETKSGTFAIESNIIIDCTGDADTLKWLNEDFEMSSKEKLRHVTACFRVGGVNVPEFKNYTQNNKDKYAEIIKNNNPDINPWHWISTLNDNFIWFDTSHIRNIDITDVEDLTKAELLTRELSWKIFDTYKNHIPGFENSYIVDIAPLLGVRDSRRLIGQYFITENDYKKSFEDRICFAPYYYAPEGLDRLEIPYRALLPQNVQNLIVAGRSISIEHKLIDCIREIPCCFATGQAAGIAASIAANNSTKPDSINIENLRALLINQGAFI